MTALKVETLWQGITRIEAQQELVRLKSQDWPNLKQDDREEYHHQMYELAYPDIFREEKTITFEDLQNLLGS